MTKIEELATLPGPLILAIGVFDGVHLGHQAVLARAAAHARAEGGLAVAVTFDPHPARVLRPESAPRLLTSTQHKITLIRQQGIEHFLVIQFTAEFATTPPEDFIAALHRAARPLREICVGHEWSFGRGRAGNLALLNRLGEEMGFEEVGVPAVKMDGQIVSSTLIRRAIAAGEFDVAERFLGRPFTILGTVVEGDRLGRTIGFPTANLSAHNEQFPPNGVYAVEAMHQGVRLLGVANLGTRPTVHADAVARIFELHLFDFDADIYGDDLDVSFRKFLRPERRFPDLESLRRQIAEDAEEARTYLKSAR